MPIGFTTKVDVNALPFAEAGISNPNVSEEKKQELRERLDEYESSGAANSQEAKNAQVAQGHKV